MFPLDTSGAVNFSNRAGDKLMEAMEAVALATIQREDGDGSAAGEEVAAVDPAEGGDDEANGNSADASPAGDGAASGGGDAADGVVPEPMDAAGTVPDQQPAAAREADDNPLAGMLRGLATPQRPSEADGGGAEDKQSTGLLSTPAAGAPSAKPLVDLRRGLFDGLDEIVFVDMCGGPGSFSEALLRNGLLPVRGYGMTLGDSNGGSIGWYKQLLTVRLLVVAFSCFRVIWGELIHDRSRCDGATPPLSALFPSPPSCGSHCGPTTATHPLPPPLCGHPGPAVCGAVWRRRDRERVRA